MSVVIDQEFLRDCILSLRMMAHALEMVDSRSFRRTVRTLRSAERELARREMRAVPPERVLRVLKGGKR